MAERRAMNKYYPPDYDPKKGSVNTQLGQHHLRDRVKKNGVLVVRFEMPYNVWCQGCSNHIGRGTRFNAHKKIVGKYLSSNIISFKMKCRLCNHPFEIQTDPEHAQFKLVSGLKRKEETWDQGQIGVGDDILGGGEVEEDGSSNSDDGEQEEDSSSKRIKRSTTKTDNDNLYGVNIMGGKIYSEEEKNRLELDPMFKLQHVNRDKERANRMAPSISNMFEMMKTRNDNYKMSSLLRKSFREEKKEREKEEDELKQRGIVIPLLPLTEQDKQEARNTDFLGSLKRKANQTKQFTIDNLKSSSIFSSIQTNNNNHHPNNNNNNNININPNNNNNNNDKKRKEILKKKSQLDQSLFKARSNNNKIGSLFSSNLFSSTTSTNSNK